MADSAEVCFREAVGHWVQGRRDQSFYCLQETIRLNPAMAAAQEWLSQWYLQEGMGEAAQRHIAAAVKLSPRDKSTLTSQAIVLEAAGDLKAAWKLLRKLMTAGYTPPRIATLYARMAPRHGECMEALALVDRLLTTAGSPRHQCSLHFAAAGLLDTMGRYDEAFSHASRAHEISRPPYIPAANSQALERLIAYFTPARLARLPRATDRSDKPVFIVGMPRSGTSLVEQILASHALVHGAGELDFLHRIRLGAAGMLSATEQDLPNCLDRLTVEHANGLGQLYIGPLAAMRPKAARVTDKMALNFMHLWLIALLLPGARVIHCRRDPLDTCLSCFMTHFTAGHEFTSDLAYLGLFYRQYERIMSHWNSVLDLPILEVSYERLVADPEGESRRMIDFLGLPWDRRCLRFYRTTRFVATASVEQVRTPMYTSSVRRWRHYEKHLGPLRKILQ